MFNPLMKWINFQPLFEEESGNGGGDTGAGEGTGENAGDGGEGTADGNSGQPDPVLGGGTGKTEDNPDGDKAADDKSGADEGEGAGDEGDEDNSVPEGDASYEFKMPEGVEMDEELASEMTPLLKDLKIGNADANKLATALTTYMQKQAEGMMDAYVDKVNKWTSDAKADKELGADWDGNVAIANNALQKFGTPELTASLAETGMSNHPEMIRFMYRVAKATGNDTLDRGKDVDTSDLPPEASWYGKTTPDKKAG